MAWTVTHLRIVVFFDARPKNHANETQTFFTPFVLSSVCRPQFNADISIQLRAHVLTRFSPPVTRRITW